jgi:hypothetical protein
MVEKSQVADLAKRLGELDMSFEDKAPVTEEL